LKYKVSISSGIKYTIWKNSKEEIKIILNNFIRARKWCKENCNNSWGIINENVIFESENDAILFRLFW